MQLLFADAAYMAILRQHRNVYEVVQVAENAYLTELRHTGQEGKLDVGIARFQHPVEGLQRIAVLGLERIVADGLQQRFVVLVDKDDHRHACLLGSRLDN